MTDFLHALVNPIEIEIEEPEKIVKILTLREQFAECSCPDEFRSYPFNNEEINVATDLTKFTEEDLVSNPELIKLTNGQIIKKIIKMINKSSKQQSPSVSKLILGEHSATDVTWIFYTDLYDYVDLIILRSLRENNKDLLIVSIKECLNHNEITKHDNKPTCIRIIFYLAYYMILLSNLTDYNVGKFIDTVKIKINEIEESNQSTRYLTPIEIESYKNFLNAQKDTFY